MMKKYTPGQVEVEEDVKLVARPFKSFFDGCGCER